MTDKNEIYNELQSIYAILPADEYPETYDYITNMLADEECMDEPLDMANALAAYDKQTILPEYLIDFITELLDGEIEKGNSDAMNDLGAMYYDGHRGFEQSFEKAVYYYDMAAENGNRPAQENLGYCYYYGRIGAPDYKKAFHYFALGAFDGHLISLYKIGDMYLNGYYVKKNEKEAFFIYSRCIDTMTDEAMPFVAGPVFLRLGNMYLNGIGTGQNFMDALACYQRAEFFLFSMVKDGNYMYKNSLFAAIAGQQKVREKLSAELPERDWTFDES